MAYDILLNFIEQVGYVALFLVLCLGLIGLPIPNETVVMTGGALAAAEVLSPIPAFVMTCLGICSAMTFGYSIGRFAGSRFAGWFKSRKHIGKFLIKSEELSDKYGGYAISISLCLPFLRHATPYVVGMNRMRFTRFILFAYPSAFVWTLAYFILGFMVSDQVEHLSKLINKYESWFMFLLAFAIVAFIAYRIYKAKSKKDSIERTM